MEFVRLASIAEIPEGEMRAYDLDAGRVALAHIEARVFAFGDECTHMGCSLAETGALDDRETFVECKCHGSVFDVETGEPVEGPAQDPVPVYQVRIVDDWVEVANAPGGET